MSLECVVVGPFFAVPSAYIVECVPWSFGLAKPVSSGVDGPQLPLGWSSSVSLPVVHQRNEELSGCFFQVYSHWMIFTRGFFPTALG